MKFYKMKKKDRTKGVCWKYALACVLGISPEKVPNFVKKNSKDDSGRTREWLKRKFNKSMVYVPIRCFMETSTEKNNPCGGPDGYSIMILSTNEEDVDHAVIAKDGKFFYDPNDEFGGESIFLHPTGYCIIYNL
jgi:hypothetical protein